MDKIIKLPEFTKRVDGCVYLVDNDTCHCSLNVLRKYGCNDYCAISIGKWLSQLYPELSDEEVKTKIVELGKYQAD